MKQDMQEKLDTLNNSIRNLQGRADMYNAKTKQEVEAALEEAEGECNRLAEEIRLRAEKKKSKVYAEILKTQMSYRQKKQSFRDSIADCKFTTERAVARQEALDAADYAAFMVDIANYAAQEAYVAAIDAQQQKMNFEEQYGEPLDS